MNRIFAKGIRTKLQTDSTNKLLEVLCTGMGPQFSSGKPPGFSGSPFLIHSIREMEDSSTRKI